MSSTTSTSKNITSFSSSKTDLDNILQQREMHKTREDMLFKIKRKYPNLTLFANYIEPSENITRDLINQSRGAPVYDKLSK